MPTNPNILLQGRVADVGPALSIFNNALARRQQEPTRQLQNQLLQGRVQQQNQQNRQAASEQDLMRASQLFDAVGPLIKTEPTKAWQLAQQIAPQLGLDEEDLSLLQSSLAQPETAYNALAAAKNAHSNLQQSSASAQSLPSDARNRLVSQSIENPEERRRFELAAGLDPVGLEREKADIEAGLTVSKERTKQTESRRSEFLKEQGDRNRIAARSKQTLARASKLADLATQGVTGNVKVGLSRLIPSINVESEADLDQAFKQIALEGLQAFKGPTTDFEFGVVQDIAGELGSGASANKAKIKALQRAVWFTQQEFKQSKKWLKDNKSPDDFSFDFGERINTKRGEYSLQDLQDTAVVNSMTIEEVLQALDK